MKLALYSDLHLKPDERIDFTPLDVEVVLLVGDIARHTRGLESAARFGEWPSQPAVVYVAGNHEYYDSHLGLLSELSNPAWADRGIHFLECQSLELGDVRFLGCTLWSGFDLYGAERSDAAMKRAQETIADYRWIHATDDRLLTPADTRNLYRQSVHWLETELSKPWAGKTVVATHFAPHSACVAQQFTGDVLTPYFVSDLSYLMCAHRIDLWAHGHTHWSTDVIVDGDCRVVSNQRGYASEAAAGHSGFRPGLVIDV